jgi:hypothetical protein
VVPGTGKSRPGVMAGRRRREFGPLRRAFPKDSGFWRTALTRPKWGAPEIPLKNRGRFTNGTASSLHEILQADHRTSYESKAFDPAPPARQSATHRGGHDAFTPETQHSRCKHNNYRMLGCFTERFR